MVSLNELNPQALSLHSYCANADEMAVDCQRSNRTHLDDGNVATQAFCHMDQLVSSSSAVHRSNSCMRKCERCHRNHSRRIHVRPDPD